MNARPKLAFVGGFLGSGKTTLLLKAAAILQARGRRAAVILNDQDAGLVDTRIANARGVEAREVSGGCFCCRFSDLMHAARDLLDYGPDVILAEPVGSCVDLSATILQPILAQERESFDLAPLTVLVDPILVQSVREGSVSEDVEYLFWNQIAEADLVCASKSDLQTPLPDIGVPIDFRVSGLTSDGVDVWLNDVLDGKRVVGAKLLDVDYRRYAAAEAALGWLNIHADIRLKQSETPLNLVGPMTDELRYGLQQKNIAIAHLKVFDRAGACWVAANVVADNEPVATGDLVGDPSHTHELALNLRAVADPEFLRELAGEILNRVGTVTVRHLGAFRPAEPKPQFRYTERIAT